MEWQPAETAPRDGSFFLALLTHRSEKVDPWGNSPCDIAQFINDKFIEGTGDRYFDIEFTHWSHFPEFP